MKFICALILSFGWIGPVVAEDKNEDEAAKFVLEMKASLLDLFSQNSQGLPLTEICGFARKFADLDKMAETTLGHHKSEFTELQWEQYQQGLLSRLVRVLNSAFQKIDFNNMNVDSRSRQIEDGFVVAATMPAKNRPTTRAQFFISLDERENLRLFDASISGIRLLLTQKGDLERMFAEGGALKLLASFTEPACP